jgi:hypothetical protein
LDLEAVKEVLDDHRFRALFAAALFTANQGGWTIRELADQLGISKSSLDRLVQKGKAGHGKKLKLPRVEVTAPPVGAQECNHRRLYSDKRKRVCLRCLLSNFEGSPELARHQNFDPVPEDAPPPPRKFKPRLKKKAK